MSTRTALPRTAPANWVASRTRGCYAVSVLAGLSEAPGPETTARCWSTLDELELCFATLCQRPPIVVIAEGCISVFAVLDARSALDAARIVLGAWAAATTRTGLAATVVGIESTTAELVGRAAHVSSG